MLLRHGLRSSRRCPLAAGIAVLLGAPAFLGAQGAVRLELGGNRDDWARYSHRSDLVVDLPADLGGPATTRTTLRLLQRVEAAAAEAIDYVTTLEEVSVTARPTPATLPDLSGMQGLQFHHRSSRTGRTLSLRLAGQSAEAGPGLIEQVGNWLSQLGFPPLPGHPVGVGEEWSETVPVPAMALGLAVDYDVVQTRTVRLSEVRSAGQARVAFLEVRTIWDSAPDPGVIGGPLRSLRGEAQQTVRFDVARGRFLGSTGTSELELVLKPPDGAQYVAVRADGRQMTGLTASSDGSL